MHTTSLDANDFDLAASLECGQTFCWQRRGRWFTGVIDGNAVAIRQDGTPDGVLEVMTYPELDEERVVDYLGLEDDLFVIAREVGRDVYMRGVLHRWWGLRVLRQPLWETLASFICATNTSVAAIERMVMRMRRKAGVPIGVRGKSPFSVEHYVFPSPERVCRLSIKQLKACGLGYRASYLLDTAQRFEPASPQSYEEARRWLMGFKGVGNKVADCVSLFGLGMLDAFPIDRWIRQALRTHYGASANLEGGSSLMPSQYRMLSSWAREYFGRYAGYAQQYMFHDMRMGGGTRLPSKH